MTTPLIDRERELARPAPAAVLDRLLAHRDAVNLADSAQLVIFARGFSAALRRRAGALLIGIDRLFA
jgi:hypothetical protein